MTDTAAKVTALVVDDNDTKRYIIGSWLRRAGHRVVEAASAAQTWQRLAEHDVGLVVLDVLLPDMNGFEVSERIKAEPRTRSLPVIHISAQAVQTADRTHGLLRGADAYLTDPIDPDEFIATVEAVLRHSQARRRAERIARRLAAFTRASLAVSAAMSFERLTAVVARGAHEIFEVPAAVFTLPLEGRALRLVDEGRGPEHRDHPLGLLARLSSLTGLGDQTGIGVSGVPARRWRQLLPDTAALGDVTLLVSRLKHDRPPVAIAIDARGTPEQGDIDLLRQLGQMLALAMEALRSYTEEQLTSLALQRSLLPSALPHVPGWSFAVRYEPASDQTEVGGDFYEVLTRDDQVLVAIGDVQGHSLRAVTVMAELRHALRAFAAEGHGPVTVLRLLNDVMLRYHDDQTATMCLLTYRAGDRAVRLAGAGHVPPLYVHGGRARYGRGGGVLLGIPGATVGVEEAEVPPGGTVVLFTDGLIEERGVPLAGNMERMRALAADLDRPPGDLEGFTDRVITEFGPREDDVALVVLRRDAPGVSGS